MGTSVTLENGMFKDSQDKGKAYLLYLDIDRLIAPCYEAANKQPKKPRYGGWEAKEIAGHSIGHWLSAAASMYNVTHDEQLKVNLIMHWMSSKPYKTLMRMGMSVVFLAPALMKFSAVNLKLVILV